MYGVKPTDCIMTYDFQLFSFSPLPPPPLRPSPPLSSSLPNMSLPLPPPLLPFLPLGTPCYRLPTFLISSPFPLLVLFFSLLFPFTYNCLSPYFSPCSLSSITSIFFYPHLFQLSLFLTCRPFPLSLPACHTYLLLVVPVSHLFLLALVTILSSSQYFFLTWDSCQFFFFFSYWNAFLFSHFLLYPNYFPSWFFSSPLLHQCMVWCGERSVPYVS